MKKKAFSQIKEILRDAKKGKMFILVDDGDRENEGDLVIPGSKCNFKISLSNFRKSQRYSINSSRRFFN